MRKFTLAALAVALAPVAGTAALAQSTPSATAGAPAQAVTQANTTADLAALCDPAPGNPLRLESIAYCQGYMTAIGQFHTALNPPNTTRRPLFCLPNPPPTVAQAGIAFAAWARENTQHSGEPPVDGLFRWLQATYPCPAAPAAGRRGSR